MSLPEHASIMARGTIYTSRGKAMACYCCIAKRGKRESPGVGVIARACVSIAYGQMDITSRGRDLV